MARRFHLPLEPHLSSPRLLAPSPLSLCPSFCPLTLFMPCPVHKQALSFLRTCSLKKNLEKKIKEGHGREMGRESCWRAGAGRAVLARQPFPSLWAGRHRGLLLSDEDRWPHGELKMELQALMSHLEPGATNPPPCWGLP